jgi:hypothetical protein
VKEKYVQYNLINLRNTHSHDENHGQPWTEEWDWERWGKSSFWDGRKFFYLSYLILSSMKEGSCILSI